jgi:hypothetical protein
VKKLITGRKDYLFLGGAEVDLTQDEITYDFTDNEAAFGYVQELARQQADVTLIDAKYQREAVVVSFENGIARFKCKSLSGE